MSARALNWAYSRVPENSTQKLVLLALADRADEDGNCWPSIRWIAEKCAPCSERSVRRALGELCATGFLVKTKRRRHEDGTLGNWYLRLALDLDQRPSTVEPAATNGHWTIPLNQDENAENPCKQPVATSGRTRTVKGLRPSQESKDSCASAYSNEELQALWETCEREVRKAPTARSPRAAYAKLVREMLDAGWTPERVVEAAALYRKHPMLGRTMLTVASLAKWGDELVSASSTEAMDAHAAEIERLHPDWFEPVGSASAAQ